MPALTLHLLAFKDQSYDARAFVAKLHSYPSVKVVVASRPRHVVVQPTLLDANQLLTQKWDLMLLLQPTGGQSQGESSLLPPELQDVILTEYRILAGIPSKLLANFPERDAQLKKQAPPPLTGSLSKIRSQSKESSQSLEVSPELLAFMDRLTLEHDKPVTMLNLLHFHHPDGKKNYFQYGQAFIPIAEKRGGNAKIVGNVVKPPGDSAFLNDSRGSPDRPQQDWWNEISIVHYPSIRHFCDMLAGEDYQAINEKYRLKALRDTFLLCTTEFDVEDDSRAKL
ncbi:hypothetical protein TMatcc_005357 [Talaromyces marneffei ATCC 18224]|uniref:EthD domain-containing protein n=1 Tax=Talaromyces marneffei (strain ATCC 18224 / CBS 334.59 / QM 7333) TaxID=441960 RepID=B6QB67_TALMQ|nr:uncharacterized protein EYB26_006090 [Talaromyces marneffei]EEA26376.1 conserved hypothetical protein [Talaromyces marneffei ATCC 18224]KAE8555069.1 hypothetical protein EYB25_003617 [Talaromyces marneffei]QGA18405.1 hypothetical protein EYB26_006090 [Talaromyces marneffei]